MSVSKDNDIWLKRVGSRRFLSPSKRDEITTSLIDRLSRTYFIALDVNHRVTNFQQKNLYACRSYPLQEANIKKSKALKTNIASPFITEAIWLLNGILMAKDMNIQNLIIEGDKVFSKPLGLLFKLSSHHLIILDLPMFSVKQTMLLFDSKKIGHSIQGSAVDVCLNYDKYFQKNLHFDSLKFPLVRRVS